MILKSKYAMFVSVDDADWRWCKKKGTYCPKDEFNWFCDDCPR